MNDANFRPERPTTWRTKLYEVIFEADTPAGKLFDVVLLVAILLRVLSVSLETVVSFDQQNHQLLRRVEWFFTLLFTVEYALRLLGVPALEASEIAHRPLPPLPEEAGDSEE